MRRPALLLLLPFLLVLSTAVWTVTAAPAASAASASWIAQLATANVGKQACSQNSLGGMYFDWSCTGNGGYPEYWCADFAKWVWENAGVAGTGWLNAAAGSFYTYGQRYGTLSAWPAVGDAVVFDYDGHGYADHVAIVTQVNGDGSIVTVSGDWGGQSGGSEAQFASTSSVVTNSPAYPGTLGTTPSVMGMTISAYVQPVGVPVSPMGGGVAAPQVLRSGQSVSSPNGRFTFAMQSDGNLVERLNGRAIWSSGTWGHPGAWAVMQTDGNLVVYSASYQALWGSGSWSPTAANFVLDVQNDGDVVAYGPSGAIWANHPSTSVLFSGQMLGPGQELVSPNGLYVLTMQANGDLVESTGGRPLWDTGTGWSSGAWVALQRDGNFVIYSATYQALWSSGSNWPASSFALYLQDDGNLVLYAPSGAIWGDGV